MLFHNVNRWLLFSSISIFLFNIQSLGKSLGIVPGVELTPGWSILKNHTSRGKTLTFHKLNIEKNNVTVFIETTFPLTHELAIRDINASKNVFKNLYQSSPIPYKGSVTKKIICPKQHQPINKTIQFLGNMPTLFVAAASKRLSFGSCSKGNTDYTGAVVHVYLPKHKSIMKIRVFYKRKSLRKPLDADRAEKILQSLFVISK